MDLVAVLDEALLLTTELVTNGVVHARTELEIEILATPQGVSVMVLDHRCGPLSLTAWSAKTSAPGGGPFGQLQDRGRGLFLVDRLADRWGTVHHGDGKGVWFRLDRPTTRPGCAEPPGLAHVPGTIGAEEPSAERVALLAENSRLRLADTERRAWLTFLAEAGELLAQSLDVELTLALIPRLVVPRLGYWCTVHTTDASGDLHLASATHSDEDLLGGLLDRLRAAGTALRGTLRGEGVAALGAPVDGYAVPLVARGQLLGALTVGRAGATWPHNDEIAVVEDIARRAALAVDNARIHADLRTVARELQRSLLPPQLPKVLGLDFGAEYVPVGETVDVGGDFYDVMALPEDRWLVVVGDVSGKGVQVATITGLVRDVTRALVHDGRPLTDVLSRLNETLVERGGGRFCTLALASTLRRPGGLLEVGLHLAGHDQPIHIQADGSARLVGRCGTALGLFDTVKSPRVLISLHPGETLVFYTDGVTERRRGEELLGQERLRQEAATLAGFPAEVVAARLRAAALGFSPESPVDDIAILVLRNDGSA